jgi:ABC-type branched-subunit amino acid transport system substrate-binding protein
MLYPRTADFRAQAEAFRSAVAAAGSRVTTDVPFDSGTTTFTRPLQQLRSAAVRAVFIPASERDIRQLAPQLEYYGLGDVQVLGSEAWVEDEVLRTVQPRMLEGVIAATPLFRSSDAVAWEHFVGLYEATYRRTLDNPYPALGYDAARLILSQLPSGRVTRAEVARAVAGVTDFRGATGVLSARGGAISRRPFLVRIQGGRPVLLDGPGR